MAKVRYSHPWKCACYVVGPDLGGHPIRANFESLRDAFVNVHTMVIDKVLLLLSSVFYNCCYRLYLLFPILHIFAICLHHFWILEETKYVLIMKTYSVYHSHCIIHCGIWGESPLLRCDETLRRGGGGGGVFRDLESFWGHASESSWLIGQPRD